MEDANLPQSHLSIVFARFSIEGFFQLLLRRFLRQGVLQSNCHPLHTRHLGSDVGLSLYGRLFKKSCLLLDLRDNLRLYSLGDLLEHLDRIIELFLLLADFCHYSASKIKLLLLKNEGRVYVLPENYQLVFARLIGQNLVEPLDNHLVLVHLKRISFNFSLEGGDGRYGLVIQLFQVLVFGIVLKMEPQPGVVLLSELFLEIL